MPDLAGFRVAASLLPSLEKLLEDIPLLIKFILHMLVVVFLELVSHNFGYVVRGDRCHTEGGVVGGSGRLLHKRFSKIRFCLQTFALKALVKLARK